MASAMHLAWLAMLAPTGLHANSADCAACHRAIVESYGRTPMAASSGDAAKIRERFERASFTHAATGFRYRVQRDGKGLSVEFTHAARAELAGRKVLTYFIGSGATARSYVIADGGFLYEAPVAYYSGAAKWDLAPRYAGYAYPYLTRPIQPACLTCHASGLNLMAGTQNRYGSPPFREAGVSCERCHGPGEAHVKSGGAIVNPGKLPADRRDSVCAQCHLSGDVRVMRPGRDWQSYHPGDRLADSMTVFVKASGSPGMTVTGHVEKLAQSACRRVAGERLWCGSCHDPHTVPAPAARAAWFRGKCLTCHQTKPCKEAAPVRAKNGNDCAGCHMPKNTVTDAEHVVYTDHSIPRRKNRSLAVAAQYGTDAARGTDAGRDGMEGLVVFGGGQPALRDLALAYAIAGRVAQALPLLQRAEQASPEDVEVLLYLAEAYRNGGQAELAIPLYQRAIRLDPNQVTGSVGLGSIRMERGEYAEAIRHWEDALAKNAGLELVRTNLAQAQWRAGNPLAAEALLVRAVEINPGFAPPLDLLRSVRQSLGR